MAAKITIKFDQFGNVSADAVGFTGTACEDATRKILSGVGALVADDKKPEYYQVDTTAVSEEKRVSGRW
jgi:hypothetical protein